MSVTNKIPWYTYLLRTLMILFFIPSIVSGLVYGCGEAGEAEEKAPSRYAEDNPTWEMTKLRCISGYEFVTYTRSEGAGITQVLNVNGGGVPCQVEREP